MAYLPPYVNKCRVNKDSFCLINRPDHQYHDLKYSSSCLTTQTVTKWELQGSNLILTYILFNQDDVYKMLRLTDTNFDLSITLDHGFGRKSDNLEIYLVKGVCKSNFSFCD